MTLTAVSFVYCSICSIAIIHPQNSGDWLFERTSAAFPGSLVKQSTTAGVRRSLNLTPNKHVPSASRIIESPSAQVVMRAMQSPANTTSTTGLKPALLKMESSSILDKSIEAISGVGNLFEGFAVTLDTVIGQAFEDWGTPNRAKARQTTKSYDTTIVVADTMLGGGGWGDFDLDDSVEEDDIWYGDENTSLHNVTTAHNTVPRQAKLTPPQKSEKTSTPKNSIANWREKALELQEELRRLKVQQQEFQKIKENDTDTIGGRPPVISDTIVTHQLTAQMEALLAEKARLAQENDRLVREKANLQELLEYTMAQQALMMPVGDEELFKLEELEGTDEID